MILDFLPQRLKKPLYNLNTDLLFEIRLRTGFPIVVNYSFNNCFLSDSGMSKSELSGIVCQDDYIKEIILNVTERSVYAYNDKIKKGFITTREGVRIGIAGECVYDGNNISTIKEFTSLLIRVPHSIVGCADEVFEKIKSQTFVYNTLIISPPFMGKTTILKDLCRLINKNYFKSILIIDERGEFACVNGLNIDKIKFSDKLYAFSYGIRSLAPSIVITDELSSESDFQFANKAANSGIKIIASCHADDIKDLFGKNFFINNVFERYVVLGMGGAVGKIKCVYDKDFVKI